MVEVHAVILISTTSVSSPQSCSVNRSKWQITCIFISEEAVKSELSKTGIYVYKIVYIA